MRKYGILTVFLLLGCTIITIMSTAVAPMSPSHFGPGIQKDPENNQKVSDVDLLGVAAIIKSMWVFLPKVSHFFVYFLLSLEYVFMLQFFLCMYY